MILKAIRNLILDVGCGDLGRGDVNLDLNIGKTQHLYFPEQKICPHETKNFVRGDAHHLPFRNSVFSKVLCFHVLEHLDNPNQAVREFIRVTNGECEIRVPHGLHEKFQYLFFPKRGQWLKQFHKHSFRKRDLESLLQSYGGHVRYNYNFVSFLTELRKHVGSRQKGFMINYIYGFVSRLFPPIPDELVGTIK